MKKTSSVVWRFFDRLEENKRCVAVLCKLCDTQYKYFGNTTNLRTHLVNKHPIQWDLLQNGSLDESTFRAFDDEDNTNQSLSTTISSRPKRRRIIKSFKNENVRYSVSVDLNKHPANQNETGKESMPVIEIQRVDVLDHSDIDGDHIGDDSDLNQIQDTRASDEEWLEEEIYQAVDYEPKRKKLKHRHIKREIATPPRRPSYVVQTHSTPKPYPRTEKVFIDNSSRKDENSVFGEYVANKLRKFRGQQTRGNVQQLITTILWQAEYGLYDNMESVKRVLLHSVQDMEVEQSVQEQDSNGQIHIIDAAEDQKDKNGVMQCHVNIVDAPSE